MTIENETEIPAKPKRKSRAKPKAQQMPELHHESIGYGKSNIWSSLNPDKKATMDLNAFGAITTVCSFLGIAVVDKTQRN